MAALDELISKIQDDDLRGLIKAEFDKLRKRKKFGLVFESANEFSPLFGLPVKVGALVAKKNGGLKEIFKVTALDGDTVTCTDGKESFAFDRADLIVVNRLGDSICPALSKIDDVANAPDSNLWHVLIEAENFHALQLLRYLYAGKVDCIYIDPPYNTGARDWKYNNDYVDANDNYRHSKWLAMMERRLALAKELLSDSGAIFISIDDNEQATLKLLCDEIFGRKNFVAQIPWQSRQSLQNDTDLSINHEFITVYAKKRRMTDRRLKPSNADCWHLIEGFAFNPLPIDESKFSNPDNDPRGAWKADPFDAPNVRPNLTYPIINPNTNEIFLPPKGRHWRVEPEKFSALLANGRIVFGKTGKSKPQLKVFLNEQKLLGAVPNSWFDAENYGTATEGTKLLQKILGNENIFSTPKPTRLIKKILRLATNKDSLVLDFFAGSGTTLHAVNLLNAEDGGRRRCILVTNNEVSEAEAKRLTAAGLTPADDAWQELGIARHVTWQRTVCSIEGHDITGAPLTSTYLGTERAMADGFAANAIFFKLTSLDKDAVAQGDCFKELLAVLWLKAGGLGKCPTLEAETLPPYKIFAENKFAVLLDERHFGTFAEALRHAAIETVFILTGSNAALNRMRALLGVPKAYRLYGDYLKNIKLKEARR